MKVAFSLPLRTKNPTNSRESWPVVSRRSKSERAVTKARMLLAMSGGGLAPSSWLAGPVVVTLTRVSPSATGLDPEWIPAALKAVQDGIADVINPRPVYRGKGTARVLVGYRGDDRDPRLTWRYQQRRGPWGVEVVIERAEARMA